MRCKWWEPHIPKFHKDPHKIQKLIFFVFILTNISLIFQENGGGQVTGHKFQIITARQ